MTDVREAVLVSLRLGMDRETLDDFLASIDWSHHSDADPVVRDTLGALENWTTMYREGDLDAQQYAEKLLGALHHRSSLTA